MLEDDNIPSYQVLYLPSIRPTATSFLIPHSTYVADKCGHVRVGWQLYEDMVPHKRGGGSKQRNSQDSG